MLFHSSLYKKHKIKILSKPVVFKENPKRKNNRFFFLGNREIAGEILEFRSANLKFHL